MELSYGGDFKVYALKWYMGEDNNSTNNTDNTNNSKQSNDIGRKPIKYEAMNFEDIIENVFIPCKYSL